MLAESDVSCARILRVSLARVVVLCVHYLDGACPQVSCRMSPEVSCRFIMSHAGLLTRTMSDVPCRFIVSYAGLLIRTMSDVSCRSPHVSCRTSHVSCRSLGLCLTPLAPSPAQAHVSAHRPARSHNEPCPPKCTPRPSRPGWFNPPAPAACRPSRLQTTSADNPIASALYFLRFGNKRPPAER